MQFYRNIHENYDNKKNIKINYKKLSLRGCRRHAEAIHKKEIATPSARNDKHKSKLATTIIKIKRTD